MEKEQLICPICDNELTLCTGNGAVGNPTFMYVCNPSGHFMTDVYIDIDHAKAEVISGHKNSETSKIAYLEHDPVDCSVTCSHCKTHVGNLSKFYTDAAYKDLASKNKYCRCCGRKLLPDANVDEKQSIPRFIQVHDYNKIYKPAHDHAESFIKLLDKSIAKSGHYEDVMHQLSCIGWPESKPTILAALDMYKQICLSKCVGRHTASEYRQVTLCMNCDKCYAVTDDGCLCMFRGLMPSDGHCHMGLPKSDNNVKKE